VHSRLWRPVQGLTDTEHLQWPLRGLSFRCTGRSGISVSTERKGISLPQRLLRSPDDQISSFNFCLHLLPPNPPIRIFSRTTKILIVFPGGGSSELRIEIWIYLILNSLCVATFFAFLVLFVCKQLRINTLVVEAAGVGLRTCVDSTQVSDFKALTKR
jgi:hypothetical protein